MYMIYCALIQNRSENFKKNISVKYFKVHQVFESRLNLFSASVIFCIIFCISVLHNVPWSRIV